MRTKITLACTECKQRNYNMTKDKKTHPDRMETKKYCRFCKKHTMHKETKVILLSKGREIMEENTVNAVETTEKTAKADKVEKKAAKKDKSLAFSRAEERVQENRLC